MRDALRVRRIQPIGYLDREVQQLVDLQGLRPNPVLEGLPLQILHGDEGLAFILADLVDGTDMGMVQSGGGARFALKTLQSLAVLGKMFREELQGDEAAELGVLGLINHTHPAATQLLEDAV